MDIRERVWMHMSVHVQNLEELIRVLGAVVTGVLRCVTIMQVLASTL